MDGNRRWARKNKLQAILGHTRGADRAKEVVQYALESQIPFITLWALSTDNWKKRDPEEVQHLMKLIEQLPKYFSDFQEKNIRFETVGGISELPDRQQQVLHDMKESTKDNTALTVILALNYGGQDEVMRGIQTCLDQWIAITQESLSQNLDSARFPMMDLMIRTWGDIRTSGFYLWNAAYAEMYFTDTRWPEFSQSDWGASLEYYQSCKRNFGK